jgi:hypothetical protein
MPLSRRFLGRSAARTLLHRVGSLPLTYDPVGMSLGRAEPPAGFRELKRSRTLGSGQRTFEAVGTALLHMDLHRRSRFRVHLPTLSLVEGRGVAVALPWGPFAVTGACRIVAMIAEPRRSGFAYGTLPRHPECGEESFLVEWGEDGQVVMTVHAWSKPAAWFTRLAGPYGRGIQRRVAARLLRAGRRIAKRVAKQEKREAKIARAQAKVEAKGAARTVKGLAKSARRKPRSR